MQPDNSAILGATPPQTAQSDNSAVVGAEGIQPHQAQPTENSAIIGSSVGNPDDVSAARTYLGKQDFDGLCEVFAEKVTGSPQMGATATDAWNNWLQKGAAYSDYQNAPAGSLIYFAPDNSNGQAGHVAVSDGKGGIVGATYSGVETYGLNDWIKQTGQKPLGYVIPTK